MSAALTGVTVIGAGTFLGTVRSRIWLVSLLFAVALVGLSVSAASVSFGEQARLIIDVGLAAASALGSAMAIALSVSSFAGELTLRTAYPVLARPLPRGVFVVGKWLGLWAAMALVVLLMLCATAVVVWMYGDVVPAAFWGDLLLCTTEMGLVVAVAILFSTLATPVLAASYSGGLVLVGNFSADLLDLAAKAPPDATLRLLVRVAHYVLPDLQVLSLRLQVANNLPVPGDYVLHAVVYGVAYSAVALTIATLAFGRRRAL